MPISEHRKTYVKKITGNVSAAVGVIRVWGPSACDAILRCWQSATSQRELKLDHIYYGHWLGPVNKQHDNAEDVVLCRIADDVVEIHSHGGVATTERIMEDLLIDSTLETATEEYSVDFQSIDTIQRNAWKDLQKATTVHAAHLLLTQANGKLSEVIKRLIDDETALPEHKAKSCDELIGRSRVGMMLRKMPEVAILGPPNAGKSTLLNRLLGWERSIVDPTPGTTRDILREEISLDGWPLAILDTAGLRTTADSIEVQGISKARQLAERAQCILLLVDATDGWSELHQDLYDTYRDKTIVVQTKMDLLDSNSTAVPNGYNTVDISAKSGQGIDHLIEQAVQRLGYDAGLLNEAVPFRQEQIDALKAAKLVLENHSLFAAKLQRLLDRSAN